MFSAKKGGLLFILLLCSLLLTVLFATTALADFSSTCGPNDVIVYTNDIGNAHASLDPSSAYSNYQLCFTSADSGSSPTCTSPNCDVLKPSDPGQNRACRFGNEVLALSSQNNAHVEGPAVNTYSYSACFGYLDCRLSTTAPSQSDIAQGEQIVAYLSNYTNAHLNSTGGVGTAYPQYLICREPLCNANTKTSPKMSAEFPVIETFENSSDAIIASLSTSSPFAGIAPAKQIGTAPAVYHGQQYLRVNFTIPQTPAGPYIATMGLPIRNNWTGYDFLEFYIWVDNSLGVDLRFTTGPNNLQTIIPLSSNYSSSFNGLGKRKWSLVRIPLSLIPNVGQVSAIDFIADPAKYSNLINGTTVTYYIDDMQLTSISGGDRDYCSAQVQNGAVTYSWVKTLNNTDATWANAIAPWIRMTPGGKACGESVNDTFADGTTGCFESKTIDDGWVFDYLTTKLDPTPILCKGNVGGKDCRIVMPLVTPATLLDYNSTSNFTFDSYGAFSTHTLSIGGSSSSQIVTSTGGSRAISVRGLVSANNPTHFLQAGFYLNGTGNTNINVGFADASKVITDFLPNPNVQVTQDASGPGISKNADGTYTVDVSKPVFVVVSAPSGASGEVVLQISTVAGIGFTQFSGRGYADSSMQLILGYQPDHAIRAVATASGYKLKAAGVTGATIDPSLKYYDLSSNQNLIGSNDNWGTLTAAQKTNLAQFSPSGNDVNASAYPVDTAVGHSYTVNVNGAPGEVLAEMWFANVSTPVQTVAQSGTISIPDTLVYNITKPRFAYGNQTWTATGPVAAGTAPNTGEKFYSCGPTTDSRFTDVKTGTTVGQQCAVVSGFACSPQGYFTSRNMTSDGNMTVVAAPSDPAETEKLGCCGIGQCYAAGQCWQNQTFLPASGPIQLYNTSTNQYRCMNGAWKATSLKWNYDGSESGYCPDESQCFVTKTPDTANGIPGCIPTNSSFKNYYCEAGASGVGNWTSRTSILASKMLDYAQNTLHWNSGTLYCDNFDKVLNEYSSINLDALKTACATPANPLTGGGSDTCLSACVFAPGNGTSGAPFFGIVLGKKFSELPALKTAFDSSCADLESANLNLNTYARCGNTNYLYAPNLSIIMYNPNSQSWIVSAWQSVKGFFYNLFGNHTYDAKYDVVHQSQLFTRLYYTLNVDPSIIAFNEKRCDESTIANGACTMIDYFVFNIKSTASKYDICNDVVTPFNIQHNPAQPENWVSCKGDISTGVTIVGNGYAGFGQLQYLWPKLTGQFRSS